MEVEAGDNPLLPRRRACNTWPLGFTPCQPPPKREAAGPMSVLSQPQLDTDPARIVAEVEAAVARMRAVRAGIAKVIYGQETVVDRALITIMAGGHGLLIGVPGLAKTKLVETIGTVCGLSAARIQFTPDLMPSDILGSEVMDVAADGSRAFRFVPGPVFTQLLMADEINRASPRTQSALLQSMQEHHVTVAGRRHDLPSPFHVLATQNPLEQEGTYPLARGPARPLPPPDRRRLSRPRGRAADAVRDHRRHRGRCRARARCGRRQGRSSSSSGACRSASWWSRRSSISSARRGPARATAFFEGHRLGSRPARQPGADARGARARPHRRPPGAVARRCRRILPSRC